MGHDGCYVGFDASKHAQLPRGKLDIAAFRHVDGGCASLEMQSLEHDPTEGFWGINPLQHAIWV